MSKPLSHASRAGAVCLIVLTGCAATAFQKAQKTDTIRAYSTFLQEYPDTEHAAKAHARIEALYYQKAKEAKGDAGALESVCKEYTRRYPDGRHVDACRSLMEETHYQVAQNIHTIPSYEEYVEHYPTGIFVGEAEEHIESLRYEHAVEKGSVSSLRSYLEKYPNGTYAKTVQNELLKLEHQLYAEALASKNCRMLKYFLSLFPNSAHRQQVETQLERCVEAYTEHDHLITYERLGWPLPVTGKEAYEQAKQEYSLLITGRVQKTMAVRHNVCVLKEGEMLPGGVDPDPGRLQAQFLDGEPVGNPLYERDLNAVALTCLEGNGIYLMTHTTVLPVGTMMSVSDVVWDNISIDEGTVRVAEEGLVLLSGAKYYKYVD